MTNMKLTVHENVLTIEIDLGFEGGSQTGRGNTMLASTSNWEKLDEIKPGLSLNMALVQKARVK